VRSVSSVWFGYRGELCLVLATGGKTCELVALGYSW
jgi:hypothetical protein